MKHRIAPNTGLGSSAKVELNNQGEINQGLAKEVIEMYFSKYDGCDFEIDNDKVSLGIEPTYQYDPLKIVTITRNKNDSSLKIGRAFGPYGSKLVAKIKTYSEYKTKSKFVKFVDKWHPIIFPEAI